MSPPSASYTRIIRSRPAHAISPAPGKAEARGAKVSAAVVLPGQLLLRFQDGRCYVAVRCCTVLCAAAAVAPEQPF
eukprot:scaffold104361_cov36-Phaeocystis_antarctica.AAC.1